MKFLSRIIEIGWIYCLLGLKQYSYLKTVCLKNIESKTDLYFTYDILSSIEFINNNVADGIEYKLKSILYIKRERLKASSSMELLELCIKHRKYDSYDKIFSTNHEAVKKFYLSDYYFFECFHYFVRAKYTKVVDYYEKNPCSKGNRAIELLIKHVKNNILSHPLPPAVPCKNP